MRWSRVGNYIPTFFIDIRYNFFHFIDIIYRYLLYILNLPKLPMTTEQKTPNMGKIQAKCDQTAKSVAGYKWSRKVAIFGMAKEKGLT